MQSVVNKLLNIVDQDVIQLGQTRPFEHGYRTSFHADDFTVDFAERSCDVSLEQLGGTHQVVMHIEFNVAD